jgi:hypothetical protein
VTLEQKLREKAWTPPKRFIKKIKIYGTRRRGHREKHYVKKENRTCYFEVRRDKKGHFLYKKKWTPKKPLKAETYTELNPLVIGYKTGKEAYGKVMEAVREWEWIKFKAESP